MRVPNMRTLVAEPIAIIGIGCRFPGASSDPSKLWELLREPRDLSRRVQLDRFDPNGFYHADGSHHGTTNVRNAYCMDDDPRHFDAQFFSTKATEANAMDPQQRILLETVYEAVEAAGLRLHEIQGTNTAVYVGVMGGDYYDMAIQDLQSIPSYTSTGTARSMLSNRISYFFDWHGPSMTIDTACSSSLVALHQGVQALQSGTANMAVVAGANLILGPQNFVAESKLGMLSPTGRCRMWDASADGYARGDGFAAVIIKRLGDAIKDGDDIECIIRGSGVNQDGQTKGGITMPSSELQAALIRQVYANSGLDVGRVTDRCQYFEAHGTGTPAGDPIEAAAIAGAFFETGNQASEDMSPLYVGSIKTVIGHTEGTAGLAGLIKASLAIKHGLIPPNLHLDRLHPNVEPFCTMLKIPTAPTPWPAVPDGTPRRASINSFGFGGTNAHAILESYHHDSGPPRLENGEFPLTPLNFSAPTRESLKRYIEAYAEYLKDHPNCDIYDMAYTLACRRSVFQYRASIGAFSKQSLRANMIAALDGVDKIGNQPGSVKLSGILGIFTGQGAQWAEMGRDLISSSQLASDTIGRLERYISELPAADRPTWSLREEILASVPASRLHEAELAQPSCTAVQIALVDILRAARVKLAAVVGHSSGEIAAAYAAGYLSDRDAIYISYYRGLHTRLSKGPNGERGAMMAVGTTLQDAQDLCDFPEMRGRLSVAAVNSRNSITLSGDEDAITTAKIVFEDEGQFARVLKVDKGYHSQHMDACSDDYIASLTASDIQVQRHPDAEIPWFSSVYGRLLSPDSDRLEDLYWNENMVQPVLFSQAIISALQEGGPYAAAIEIGPHPALKGPTLQSMEETGAKRIPYIGMLQRGKNNIETVSNALGFIWAHAGEVAIDFEALLSHGPLKPRLLKDLPSYPWDHRRSYWHESRLSKASRTRSDPVHELLGVMLPDGTEQELRWRNLLSPKEVPWLQGHQIQGAIVLPASAYVVMALEASAFINGASSAQTVEVQDLVIGSPIVLDDESTGVETLFALTNISRTSDGTEVVSANFKCFASPNKSSAAMVLTASGDLRLYLRGSLSTALPLRSPHLSNPVNVDTDRFYSALSDIGYGYKGPFRGLSAMKRKLGVASALVANPSSFDLDQPLLVHPAMLDSVFQSAFCAYCWPGDGMLFSLHVPNRVARIRVNLHLARTALRQPGKLPVDCVLTPSTSAPIHGDMEVYPLQIPGCRTHAIIQIEGMAAVPISAPTKADDRKLFEDVLWGPAEPETHSCAEGGVEAGLASLTAQVTFRYAHLRIIDVADSNMATPEILREIRDAFESYTVTRPPSHSIGLAKTKVSHGRAEFKALDIHSDILSQGFLAHSYGLAVVSGLEPEVDLFEAAIKQLRRLLQPGGYLLLSQSFASQRPSLKDPEKLMDASKCGLVLQRAGFSGIDSTKDFGGTSLITSQAVDHRVLALRKPLQCIWTTTASQEAVIIGGSFQPTIRIAKELEKVLCKHFKRVMLIEGVDSPGVDLIPSGATLVSLIDVDEPLFKGLTANKLQGLKSVFEKSKTVLWVTRGCFSMDPFANMMVGFGRSLLLETPYLQVQFLDIDPKLPVTAEVLAETLLRLRAANEWRLPESGHETLPVWTTEPELALTKDGILMISRVMPSQERNNRYNSSRREITKEIDVKSSVVEIQYQERSTSYALLEPLRPTLLQHSSRTSSIEVSVRYSCLLALRVEGLGYLYPVLGCASDSGRRVLALSETQASRVSVRQGCYVPCPEEVSEDREASYLLSFVASLYTLALFAQVGPGDVMLVHEAPPALEAALLEMAEEHHTRIHFLTISREIDVTAQKEGFPRLSLPPNASSRLVKSRLPRDVSVFVTHALSSDEGPGNILSQIAACLPRFHRRIDFWTLWSRVSATLPSSSADIDIKGKLNLANSRAERSRLNHSRVIDLSKVVQVPSFADIMVISWLGMSTVNVTVKPVDSEALFAKDRTYLLVGLVGDLGKSLTQWMVEHGAKYIVLTSRNPRIDKNWIETLENIGAVIRVYANDITDKSALQQVIEEVKETLPSIAGVANGAMVLEDMPVAELTVEKMGKVMGPKVQGSIHLDELFGDMSLDFFILFSSVAAVVGNRGQSSYSAANAFMCSLAAQRRARGLAASVIHIGAVVGTGYLTREVSQGIQDYLRKAGYLWMSERDFHQVFAEGVLASPPASRRGHEIMSGLNMEDDARNTAVWYKNPKFQQCVSNRDDIGLPAADSKQSLPLAIKAASASCPAEASKIITDAFTAMLQTTLLLEADARMLERSANNLGIDSLVAVAIRSWFSRELNVDLPVMKILGGATIGNILDYALERSSLAISPDHREDQPSSGLENPPVIEAGRVATTTFQRAASGTPDAKASGPPSCVSGPKEDQGPATTNILPLSFSQSRFWFLQSFLEDKTSSNVTCLLSLKGPLSIADLDRAVRVVGEHHEGLRTAFIVHHGQPSQVILNESLLRLETKTVTSDAEVAEEFDKAKQHVFDLQSGKTMKILLLERSPMLHHLIVFYHHINMDGVSFLVLVADLAKAYSGTKLRYPILQYPHFSERQRQRFNRGEWLDQIAYWRREYSEMAAPLPVLPISRVTTRKPMTQYGFHKATVRIDGALRSRVREACRKQKATAFHFYVTVFAVLLSRLAKLDDLCIGIADAGRMEAETFGSIGNYLNLLPLRLRPQAGQSFTEALHETGTKVYAALANAAVPVDVLFAELGIERSTLHTPLFQAFVDYRNVQETQQFGDCEIEGHEYSVGRTGYDVVLDVIDNLVGDSSLTIMVQESLYTEEDARLLLESFLKLTASFSDDMSALLQAPSLYQQEQVDRSLQQGRGTEFQCQWDTLPHAVDAISCAKPSHVALKDGMGNILTYKEMSNRVACIASALDESKSLIGESARVAVLQEPGVDWICSMLAIMRVGAAYIPLDLNYGLPRLGAIINESMPSVVLIHSRTVDQAAGLWATVTTTTINVDLLCEGPSQSEVLVRSRARAPAVIMFTSGSTGTPKGIKLSHVALQNHVEGCISAWGVDSEIVLQQSPYGFDFSLFEIYIGLLTGGMVYIVSRETRGDASAITNIIAAEGITVACGVPSELMTWLQYGDRELLQKSKCKLIVSGGEPFGTSLVQELRALGKHDLKAMNLYGPTEATISATFFEVRYHDDHELLEWGVPVGCAMPNYAVYILDENLEPVPVGVPGQIAIAGSISSGYVKHDELQAERFVPDPFTSPGWMAKGWDSMYLSGDRGRLRSSDGALIFEGRIEGDTQIKLRGFRIELQDVESNIVAAANGAIVKSVCSVRGDPPELLVAHVKFSPEYGASSRYERDEFLRQLIQVLPLPRYMRPAMILPLDSVPLTVSGKLDRRAIKELPLPSAHGHAGQPFTRELNPTETLLKEIWLSVLHNSEVALVRGIDAESDFFHVGGNSLLLISLRAKIRETFGTGLPLIQLFEASSLAAMAAKIDSTEGKKTDNHVNDVQHHIDWESETSIHETKYSYLDSPPSSEACALVLPGVTVVLTGATGFLGRYILSSLLANPAVRRVHCIAVRDPRALRSLSDDDRVRIYPGTLGEPRLGLSPVESQRVFQHADAVIHNGADVSFLKTFASLRASNLDSTKELVRMVLTHRCSCHPSPTPCFHYISTVGVAQLRQGLSDFGPISSFSIPHPRDGTEGYVATKWASERFLEKLVAAQSRAQEHGGREGPLRVLIHRPSSVTGPGAPRSVDIVQNLLHYCQQLGAVPQGLEDVWHGWIDLVDVRSVAENITGRVFDSAPARAGGGGASPWYIHHSGDHEIPVAGLKAWLEMQSGTEVELLPSPEWVKRATELGMHEMVATYMMSRDSRERLFTPRILREC